MLIVLSLYAILVYLIFGRFKLLPWNGTWKSIIALLGLVIALVVIGALNYLTPSGRVAVQGVTIEITPNISGTVTEIGVKANEPVQKGDLLFRIDPTPYAAEVSRAEAALVDARSAAEGLQAELEAAEADIERIEAQLEFGFQRRDDIVQLAERGASTEFQMQEAVSNIEQLEASLDAARARKRGIEIRIGSEVEGVNAAVVQAEQDLVLARWNLEQTVVIAPDDGLVTALTLQPGQRVTSFQPAVAFLPNVSRALTAVFSQSGAHAFEIGSEVMVAMQSLPGTSFITTIEAVIPGTAEGTLSGATGTLPSVGQLVGTNQFAVRLALPEDLPTHATRLGMSGSATMITDGAGPVELLARVLFWLRMQFNYL
ncbi:biotin/lipoyl-binding protein [Ruegeria sp. HKCCD5849]|uniref:HlyD family secretion protein n=1 Tax=unclassified Ruegeria TaxID=2625375 RepID=UPI001480C4D2|nr:MULTISPECIES: biotin/lipoyl-binding protein [unclassified Ruegeria]NOD49412.1 biotin/lipoyl-binding protein [Ruegeria sp. HKCCD5849]NOD53289.1 biotin/lipoyl-binding protein [Ruegeria sp. HKCCD5851]